MYIFYGLAYTVFKCLKTSRVSINVECQKLGSQTAQNRNHSLDEQLYNLST